MISMLIRATIGPPFEHVLAVTAHFGCRFRKCAVWLATLSRRSSCCTYARFGIARGMVLILRTVILVPYRSNGEHRDQLWNFTRRWMEQNHPDCPVYVGASPDGPFNRSAAINDAARQAGDWDVAVICDSDTVVPPAQFEKAVRDAHRTGRLVSALTKVVELSRMSTDRLLGDNQADIFSLPKKRTRRKDDMTQSSVIAVPRALWDGIGGFDEGFSGWGCEDNAFWIAATLLGGEGRGGPVGGKPLRVEGAAYHLWHEKASRVKLLDPIFRANFFRLRHYKKAKTPDQLEWLIGVSRIAGLDSRAERGVLQVNSNVQSVSGP